MLGAGFPIRTVAVTAPGSYDTHADEAGALANGLKQVADTLVAFLIGSSARGGLVGGFPGLKKGLDGNGNVRATVDVRAVYASLLEQWFDVDAGPIVPGAKRMGRHKLVRA